MADQPAHTGVLQTRFLSGKQPGVVDTVIIPIPTNDEHPMLVVVSIGGVAGEIDQNGDWLACVQVGVNAVQQCC